MEARQYHSRSTRDGLGIVPDGTHPCTAEGLPAFDRFTFEHALDFILNTEHPTWADLVAAVSTLKTNRTLYAMRPILTKATDHLGTPEALPYWQALHVLTNRIGPDAEADPFSAMDVRRFRRAMEANGTAALQAAGLLTDEAPAAPAPAAAAAQEPAQERILEAAAAASNSDAFDAIISSNYPEGR